MGDRDINEVFEDILLTEENAVADGFDEGLAKGEQEGNKEAYHFGFHQAAKIGEELGYYSVIVAYLRSQFGEGKHGGLLATLTERIERFADDNREGFDISGEFNQIRALFRRCCAVIKYKPQYPKPEKISF